MQNLETENTRVQAAQGGGAARNVLLIFGALMIAAGAVGVYFAWAFARLAAWELPAYLLLGSAAIVLILGIVIMPVAVTAPDRRTARVRLMKATALLVSLVVSVLIVDAVLAAMTAEPDSDCRAVWPDYDARPFESTGPLCETVGEPDEARYPPNLTLRLCLPDFHVMCHTNANGTREIGREPSQPLTLAIGDSFTYGYGVEDDKCFAARLGWVNAGLWGRPPSSHIKALRWWAPRLKPRRVVWTIYPPHLITELPDHWMSRYQYPKLAGTRWTPALDWYHETGIGRFLHQRFGFAINRADYYTKESMLYTPPGEQLDQVYRRIEIMLREAREMASALGIELWIALVPSKLAISKHLEKATYADLPIMRLRKIADDAGVDFARIIDLTPLFASPGDVERYYFKHDAHWNEAGHARVADELARQIQMFSK